MRLKDRLEMSWTRSKFVLEIFWIKFLIRMLLYGELISLGEGVPEQEEEFLYASKMTFTGSESWLGKTENKFLSLETQYLILIKVLLLALKNSLKVLLWPANVSVWFFRILGGGMRAVLQKNFSWCLLVISHSL